MSEENLRQNDHVAVTLRRYAQNVLVGIFGLLPLLFIPTSVAPFDYSKVSIVVVGLFVAIVLYSLSVLRSGTITLGLSIPVYALWGIVGAALVSGLLSGDIRDAMIGDLFSIQATVFLVVLAIIPTTWILLSPNKTAVLRMYILLATSTLVLVLFHIARLFFGTGFLSFGVFNSNTATPVGSWNDLALLLGLTVILALVALEQLTLSRVGRLLFIGVSIASLFMLGVINFSIVWLLLGVTSLVMVVYALGKGRFIENQLPFMGSQNTTSLPVALIVFAASVLFVIGGSSLGGWLSQYTHISYVEVRPSFQATADIARNVYHENALLGIGTNRFGDAWRLYKDNSINTTAFWNTEFNAGNSYIGTFFVTTGILGGIAWIIFLLSYAVLGIRSLLNATNGDKIWYFIGVSSFVSSVYVWGMSLVYVPGVVILLLGALCTGISLYAFNILRGKEGVCISVGTNRRTGFVLTLVVITIIIGSVSVLYVAGRHYSSVIVFNRSIQSMQGGASIDELERQVVGAYQLSSSDIFARRIAEYQLARMNRLVSVTNPGEEQQKEFEKASINGVNAAQQAIQIDPQEPANWEVLGGIYSVLATVGVQGAQDRAVEAFTKSRELNPKNPLPLLESALVVARGGNLDQAKSYIEQSIALKPNFTEAFYLLSNLEIARGNTEAAIASTLAMTQLEPQNAARYYQLGVLYTAVKDQTKAIAAFQKAIDIDTNYANARYLLALALDATGKSDEAKVQLQKVLELNPGNVEVTQLIEVIQREGSLESLRGGTSRTVSEAMPTTNENGSVSTEQNSDTNLVKPVNTPPKPASDTGTQAQ